MESSGKGGSPNELETIFETEIIEEARPGLYMMRNKLDTFSDQSEFYCSSFRLQHSTGNFSDQILEFCYLKKIGSGILFY
jgi:hypothetical protein